MEKQMDNETETGGYRDLRNLNKLLCWGNPVNYYIYPVW